MRSLELHGTCTRHAGGRTTTAPFQLRILFPDRFQRIEGLIWPDGREAALKTTLEGQSAGLDGPRRIAGGGDPNQLALRYARTEFLRTKSPIGDIDAHVWRIGQYKATPGLTLPHNIVKFSAGHLGEELTIERYVINAPVTLQDFSRR
ncbi:MAG: hypothetical protein A3H96_24985 [Acidobacteria bacterium RIFCSPLOWO2_02_FULL_67_36]|nr:MAG: hypothetical protein A3H96_24985 [Acidobacteria bacterium RIFCSPLOWO2_02_FULL_67_36]OFW25694.1 MAG: hypothetical protein A3G21_24345 [Acidobacteria bacterium RIFCSPLOWO2_12_FULL_66_21]